LAIGRWESGLPGEDKEERRKEKTEREEKLFVA